MTRKQVGCLLAALAACGGESTSPEARPSPPASMTIGPASVSLAIGETRALTVSLLDRDGRPTTSLPAGFTIVWSSSDTTRVTVDARGVARGIRPGSATLVAAAGTLRAEAPATVDPPELQLEPGLAVSREIGTEGGTIEVTSGSNVRYRLEIPRLALLEKTMITLTPVSGFGRAPFMRLLGAVRFGPDGLQLLQTGRLTIELPEAPSGKSLAGLTFIDDGTRLGLTPRRLDGKVVTVPVGHFSGAGAAVVDTPQVVPEDDSNESWSALGRLLGASIAADNAGQPDVTLFAAIFKDWYRNEVKLDLTAAASVESSDFKEGMAVWRLWLRMIAGFAEEYPESAATLTLLLQAELAEAEGLAAAALRAHIDASMAECLAEQSLADVLTALLYQGTAEAYGLDRAELGLDRAAFFGKLCVSVKFAEVILPDPLSPGASAPLEARAGIAYGSAPPSEFHRPLDVRVTPAGTIENGVQTLQTSNGWIVASLTPIDDVTVHLRACMQAFTDWPAGDLLADVCAETTISRNLEVGLDLSGSWVLTVDNVCVGPLQVSQTALALSVSGSLGGPGCPYVASGTGTGVLNGSQITFGIAFGTGASGGQGGPGAVTFDGTVSANSMSGTHSRGGTWRAVRQ